MPSTHHCWSHYKHTTLGLAVNAAVNKASALLWKCPGSTVNTQSWVWSYFLIVPCEQALSSTYKRQHSIYIGIEVQFSKHNGSSPWFCHKWAVWTWAVPLTSRSLGPSSIMTSFPDHTMAVGALADSALPSAIPRVQRWLKLPAWDSPGDSEGQRASVGDRGNDGIAPQNFRSPSKRAGHATSVPHYWRQSSH